MDDIRKFFKKVPSGNQLEVPSPRATKNNGLSRERQLNLSPSPKQTKKANPSLNSTTFISSDTDSDGESPLTETLKKAVKEKRNRVIISDDEEDIPISASFMAPKGKPGTSRHSPCKSSKEKPARSSIANDFVHPSPVKSIPQIETMEGVIGKKRKLKNETAKGKVLQTSPKRKRKSSEGKNDEAKQKQIEEINKMQAIVGPKRKRTSAEEKKAHEASVSVIAGSSQQKKPSKDSLPKRRSGEFKLDDREKKVKLEDRISELPWVDKYKPTKVTELVGQHTDKSPLNKLMNWLREWPKHNLGAGALQKKTKPAPWNAQNDGTSFKAALLSGPPGIGKTTCAIFACTQLNLHYIQMNASDARNKKVIEQKISGNLTANMLEKYYPTDKGLLKSKVGNMEHVLIMDEVDGMSGNADRAGVMELIQMIKKTKVPIICICNDRQSAKIRSLANYCFDLRYSRPRMEQIKGRLLRIATQENMKVTGEVLEKIIEASNQDVRQCIHSMQLMASRPGKPGDVFQRKDVSVNMFDAARRLLSCESGLAEKQEMFFSDYSIMPLFAQENYIHVRSARIGNSQHLRAISKAAECISFGDIIGRQVRSTSTWSLLVDQSYFSCALPALIMNGNMSEQIGFPSWFGKYSQANKRQRLMRELAVHTNLTISGSNHALVVDYLPVLRDRMYRPLVERDTAVAIKEVINVYTSYNLIREDIEAINELGVWPNKKDLAQSVATKTKSALTRALNKEKRHLPYVQKSAVIKGRKKGAAKDVASDEEEGSDAENDDVEEEENVEEPFF